MCGRTCSFVLVECVCWEERKEKTRWEAGRKGEKVGSSVVAGGWDWSKLACDADEVCDGRWSTAGAGGESRIAYSGYVTRLVLGVLSAWSDASTRTSPGDGER